MKYCVYCGAQIADEAVVCPHCGRMVSSAPIGQPAQNKSTNVMCILGFVFTFIFTVAGLILSIIGYNQVKNTDDSTGKSLAKAGIKISSVLLGLGVMIFVIYFLIIVLFIGMAI